MNLVHLGASGAVGSQARQALNEAGHSLLLLNRRRLDLQPGERQWIGDVLDPSAYAAALEPPAQAALCTLGVGQPSGMSRAEFLRIDKDAVLDFARSSRKAGVCRFGLLSSVGSSVSSPSFFLRAKGELEQGLEALGFERLVIAQPSMILTPENRYGWTQGLTLAVWPCLTPMLLGPLQIYRGIPVRTLGRALAFALVNDDGQAGVVSRLRWPELHRLGR